MGVLLVCKILQNGGKFVGCACLWRWIQNWPLSSQGLKVGFSLCSSSISLAFLCFCFFKAVIVVQTWVWIRPHFAQSPSPLRYGYMRWLQYGVILAVMWYQSRTFSGLIGVKTYSGKFLFTLIKIYYFFLWMEMCVYHLCLIWKVLVYVFSKSVSKSPNQRRSRFLMMRNARCFNV